MDNNTYVKYNKNENKGQLIITKKGLEKFKEKGIDIDKLKEILEQNFDVEEEQI